MHDCHGFKDGKLWSCGLEKVNQLFNLAAIERILERLLSDI
jgi:hypothetical protein